ncbi:multidrug efflux SMR transporter [Bacillus sp. ISL-51]|uniref:DMT family transporter n=1 Tax=Bacteria TaxID=2 RepID=UPI001BE4E25F|nr:MULTISPECIES: multidrug efflux SMR transporter [Bacteria]MBT2573076.1 multidrug efflux SMR transporter [Bacillus sp. ISL-51]MBT2634979.1 multidrug efflux SMR transporter [Bacillus sp. ISL-26]MBT2712105.1 multidrug efflux SMR transporter [Pseudomonas sp. ISL-88]MBY8914883.1 multidrug efflux SMR transporter [Bacillus sp. YC2]
MYWLLVLIAGLLEVVWASALKYADSLFDWIIIFLLIAVSFLLLIRSYKKIPMAAAYTVFVGIGTVGTYVTGVFLGESFSIGQIFFLTLLLSGILGMKLFTKENKTRGEH